jgi:hypothetical protein
MFARLDKLCGGESAKARARRRPATSRRTRLELEALEERAVPTIMFMPHFGAQTMASDSANAGTQHPTVNLVFAGPFWNTQIGQQDEAAIINSTKSILNGPYLSGLTQYGSDGKANFGQSWNDAATLPNNPSSSAIQSFLQTSISRHAADPGLYDYRHAPIYLVVSDPNHSANSGGKNAPGTYVSFGQGWGRGAWPQFENINMVHIGTQAGSDGHVIKDWFTMTESHELAEVMSDPAYHGAHFNPPAALPLQNLGNQIADNEPELGQEHYGYRLGGDLVQPYWSARDQAFIVPDGNSQNFYLYPIWNNASFTDTFNLRVGDQLAINYSSHIQLGGTANVSVTMNNQSAIFESGHVQNTGTWLAQQQIKSINVNTASGSNKVEVFGLPQGVTLNIDSTGFDSHDTVVIGAGGSLVGIQGTVNIANHSGQTSVVINDTMDGARNITITDRSVAFAGLTTINYDAGYVVNGYTHGVTSLVIDQAQGSTIWVDSVGALTDTSVYWDPDFLSYPGHPSKLRGPAASKIHVIYLLHP